VPITVGYLIIFYIIILVDFGAKIMSVRSLFGSTECFRTVFDYSNSITGDSDKTTIGGSKFIMSREAHAEVELTHQLNGTGVDHNHQTIYPVKINTIS